MYQQFFYLVGGFAIYLMLRSIIGPKVTNGLVLGLIVAYFMFVFGG